jgi:hypothetical protein
MMRITGTLLLIALMFTACKFSKGFKKDLSTGLSASYNGFSIKDAFLTGSNDEKLTSNTVPLGEKISIVVTGVDNYYIEKGKVFPGCTIILKDKTGKELLKLPNAFAHLLNGQPIAEANTLKAIITTGEPMVAGETYHLEARFYDVYNKENSIVTNVDLLMK